MSKNASITADEWLKKNIVTDGEGVDEILLTDMLQKKSLEEATILEGDEKIEESVENNKSKENDDETEKIDAREKKIKTMMREHPKLKRKDIEDILDTIEKAERVFNDRTKTKKSQKPNEGRPECGFYETYNECRALKYCVCKGCRFFKNKEQLEREGFGRVAETTMYIKG